MIDYSFLERVWNTQPKGSHLFLCKKTNWTERVVTKTGNVNLKGGKWQDFAFTSIEDAIAWLKRQPESSELYWCGTWFNGPRRVKENVVGSKYLWSDLDQANPKKFDKNLKPSIAWESSPGRYQALWELEEPATPKETEEANKAIAYALHDKGADLGGFDLSQVLRIPGARNNKYEGAYSKLLWFKEGKARPIRQLKLAATAKQDEGKSDINVVEFNVSEEVEEDFAKILSRHRKNLGPKLVGLLLQDEAEEGRRSDVLWYLEHELIKRGLSVQEGIALIRGSVWNKYEGRADEIERLTHEFSRALEDEVLDNPYKKPDKKEKEKLKKEANDGREVTRSFTVTTDTELMCNPRTQPGWMVQGFWTKKSHGIVAGQPKSFKSTLIMDMMLSVASGEPFLGQFPVEQQGPVLYVQNENADWIMKDRMEKIRAAKGLIGDVEISGDKLNITFAPELPIYYVNQQGFNLSEESHRNMLEQMVEQIKPVLLILDPLYLMFTGDLNSAKELNPILSWLLNLKNKYNTSLVVVHHYNKGGQDKRGGQRMLGSATLHGWTESAWYIETRTLEESPDDPDEMPDEDFALKATGKAEVIIEREFRGAGMHQKVDLTIKMGEFGDPLYEVELSRHKPTEVKKKGGGKKQDDGPTDDQLKQEIHTQMSMSAVSWSARRMAEAVGLSRGVCTRLMKEMMKDGILSDDGDGFRLVDSD